MKNSRLFQILYYLTEHRSATARELSRCFEVSERTIYRDMDALSAAGIPVYTQQGQGGGIRLMDQFVLDRALLSPAQQDEVLFALQAVLAARAGGGETLQKLSALFRREGGDWLEVDFSDWGSGIREREVFPAVKGAILSRRVISFTYYSSSGEQTRRRAEPAKLIFKGGSWYFLAWCLLRGDWRLFRLARTEDPALEETSFLPRPLPKQLEPPPPPEHSRPMRLRFSPGAAWRVMDYFHPRQVTREPSGDLLVECAFPEDSWLLGFLLSFGDQVEVLSPPDWRALVRREAEKILGRYETGHTLSGFKEYPEPKRGGC